MLPALELEPRIKNSARFTTRANSCFVNQISHSIQFNSIQFNEKKDLRLTHLLQSDFITTHRLLLIRARERLP